MPGTKDCDTGSFEAMCCRPMTPSERLRSAARDLRERSRRMEMLADHLDRPMVREAAEAFCEIVEAYLQRCH
jgi:hypothetical protein